MWAQCVGRHVTDTPQLPAGLRNNILSLRYLLLGFALSWLPTPISGLAAIPLAISFVYGVRYLRDLKRAGMDQAVLPNVIGLVLTGLLFVMVAAPVVQYERTMDYQRCLWGANTQQARDSCESEHDEHPGAIEKFFVG